MLGSSPRMIQGIPQDDGVSDTESKGEKKRLDLPWFTQKSIKASDAGLALFTEATGALSVGGRRRASPPLKTLGAFLIKS